MYFSPESKAFVIIPAVSESMKLPKRIRKFLFMIGAIRVEIVLIYVIKNYFIVEKVDVASDFVLRFARCYGYWAELKGDEYLRSHGVSLRRLMRCMIRGLKTRHTRQYWYRSLDLRHELGHVL